MGNEFSKVPPTYSSMLNENEVKVFREFNLAEQINYLELILDGGNKDKYDF